MEQIQDAPQIREAEINGWGPEDDGLDNAIEYLEDAIESIDNAINRLDESEDEFAGNGVHAHLFIDRAGLIKINKSLREELSKYKL